MTNDAPRRFDESSAGIMKGPRIAAIRRVLAISSGVDRRTRAEAAELRDGSEGAETFASAARTA